MTSNFRFVDMSAEVYGKYVNCTLHRGDGMWYSDYDFERYGELRRGALPAPFQDTPELTAKAKAMHEAAAKKTSDHALIKFPRKPWWRRIFS